MGPLVAAVGGAFAASAVHGLTIEVLHFRHFWMLLAVICAIDAKVSGARAESGAPPERRSMSPRVAAA
jgi:hypothetical protein